MDIECTATQGAAFWHGAVVGFSTMYKVSGGDEAECSLSLAVDGEPLEGTISEVLADFQHRIADAMIIERTQGLMDKAGN